ncbi:MAG: YfhO family protein [Bacteroidota bacterium]
MKILKSFLPHLLAVAIFFIVTLIFFSPQVFQQQKLQQFDKITWDGTRSEIMDYREGGEQILWTNALFSGMPTYLVSLEYAFDPLRILVKTAAMGLPNYANRYFLCMLCAYILFLVYGARPLTAIVGAVGFGLSSYILLSLVYGHNGKVTALAFMPLVLAGLHLAFQGKRWAGGLLFMLGLALQIRVNHLQITYYTFLVSAIYVISELVVRFRKKEPQVWLRALPFLLVGVVLAVGLNLGRLWTTYEYSRYSNRSPSELTQSAASAANTSGVAQDYAFSHSNSIHEPMTLLMPNFMGGATQQPLSIDSYLGQAALANGVDRQELLANLQESPTYMGDQPGTAPYYAGAVILFLAILGVLLLEGRHRNWLLIVLVLGIFLSWGKHFPAFNELVFQYLPGYNKFRAVTNALAMSLLAFSLLAVLGLQMVLTLSWDKALRRKLLIAFLLTGGVALFCGIFAFLGDFDGYRDNRGGFAGLPYWYYTALKNDREALFRADAFRSFFFVLLAGGAVVAYFRIAAFKVNGLLATLLLLVTIDGAGVGRRYLNADNFVRSRAVPVPKTPANDFILQDPGHYRVLNLNTPFIEGYTSMYHASVGGYHAAKLRRYQDLIEEVLNPAVERLQRQMNETGALQESVGAINMLNTKFIRHGPSGSNVTTNYNALGNAWFAKQVATATSADEEMSLVQQEDMSEVAVVNTQQFALQSTSLDTTGSIALTEYHPDRMTYTIRGGSGTRLAVFSEVYYPHGWTAELDGQPISMIRANYVLRAVEIPAGAHTLVMKFEPQAYYAGQQVMTVSFIVSLFLTLGVIGMAVWQKRKQS